MIKMVYFLKRHPSLSREEFKALYESRHARLGERHAPSAARYVRRYLEPVAELFTGAIPEPEHDVITELWFADRAAYDAAMENLSRPEVMAEIVADEETIFDRSKHRLFTVDEHESPVGAAPAA